MQTWANCLLVVASAAALAAEPPGLPLTGVPLPPIRTQAPPPAGDTLPTPRPLPPPSAPPREEAAPAPREIHNFPLGAPLPGQLREEPAPMPHPATPPPPRMLSPHPFGSAPMADIQALHQAIEGLRQEREAMLNEQADLVAARDARGSGGDSARLRRRITELLAKAAARVIQRAAEPNATAPESKEKIRPQSPQSPQSPHHAPPPASTRAAPSPSLPPPPSKNGEKEGAAEQLTDAPVDPLSLAQALFQSGDAAAALAAYRKLEQEEQKPEDRITIQYMIACCLRKLGKAEEASVTYREVANSGGSEVLVESAQWYLRALRERRELQGQLEQLRQRRQVLTPRKP